MIHPDRRPKTVLFDLGKVLVDFDWRLAAGQIAPRSKFNATELLERMLKSPLMAAYELGRLTTLEFFHEVQTAIDYRGSFDDFGAAFAQIFSEIHEMSALHQRIRAAGIPTWIFSNTNDLAVTYIRNTFPFFSRFDGYFLSYQLGQMKPQPAIYETAERTTHCTGPDILYLDDFPENVAAGAARGWQTIHHVSPAQTIPLVEQALALPPTA